LSIFFLKPSSKLEGTVVDANLRGWISGVNAMIILELLIAEVKCFDSDTLPLDECAVHPIIPADKL